jgi:hypothetical protein
MDPVTLQLSRRLPKADATGLTRWMVATEPKETAVSSRGNRSVPGIRQELCVSKEYPDAKFALSSSVQDDLSAV